MGGCCGTTPAHIRAIAERVKNLTPRPRPPAQPAHVTSLYSAVGWWSGQQALQDQPRWMFLTLALSLVGGGMATAFARVSQLWHTERARQTLEV